MLLLVQNMHGYIGHIYEENLGRECESPYAKRQKLDYEMEERKVRVLSSFFDRVGHETTYRKISSSNTSRLEAHVGFFRLLMKGIFGPYVL